MKARVNLGAIDHIYRTLGEYIPSAMGVPAFERKWASLSDKEKLKFVRALRRLPYHLRPIAALSQEPTEIQICPSPTPGGDGYGARVTV